MQLTKQQENRLFVIIVESIESNILNSTSKKANSIIKSIKEMN